MEGTNAAGRAMQRIAAWIVDKRNLFFLLYVFALVFCVFSRSWVKVENDVTAYLPRDTETRQGLTVMNEHFLTPATARIMVSNITLETARQLCGELEQIPDVELVEFDDSEEHYRDAAALFEVSLGVENADPAAEAALAAMENCLAGYDTAIDTQIGYDENAMLREEMSTILVVSAFIIVAVLTLTSRAYAEVPVLLLTFGAAALLNMGTNFWYGTISFVSDAIATVLQLALAIDYAIILCHRFSDEHETKPAREACVDALAKAIPEISASSLTTVCGLAALGFMEFAIGLDMALVLIKAILFSLLTVFTLMPGLLMVFCPLIDKTRHKKLLPDITLVGRLAVRGKVVLPLLFAVLLVGGFWLSGQCPYCYSYNDLEIAKQTQRQKAYFQIKEAFGVNNMVAVIVPGGDYDAERAVLQELAACPEVKSATGLANLEAAGGHMLADALTPRQFAEMTGLDYEAAQALYAAYAAENDQYGSLLTGLSEYKVPLFDLLLYLKDHITEYNITLADGDQQQMDDLFAQLDSARQQLQDGAYSRMVVYLDLPEESDETFAFLTRMREILGEHYEGDYYVIGNSTSSRDLSSSFVTDNLLISILSALFVILVLLCTFQSAALPVLLIAVIQGSIWINFSFPTLMGQPLYFLGYLIVNAIQMGANIDYAIVISSHYQEQRRSLPPERAIVAAVNTAFPTVFTSGSIMVASGLLIGNLSAQPVVAIMGVCLGRGTIISIVLVLGVLPAILVLGDGLIARTSFRLQPPEPPRRRAAGAVRLRGYLHGAVNGEVDGMFDGVVRGQVDARVTAGTLCAPQEEGETHNG